MAHNKINDLRDHLFLALERLSDDDLTPEQMELEIKKAHAVKDVAGVIVQSAKTEVDFMKIAGKFSTATPFFQPINDQKSLEDGNR